MKETKSYKYSFPKIIHQTVKDKHQLSCEQKQWMETWRDLNPGYEHRIYDDHDCLQFVIKYHPHILTAYKSLSSNVERADMFRYLALCTFGGVYADTDTVCQRPINQWNSENNHDAALLVGLEADVPKSELEKWGLAYAVQFAQWTMASTPGHRVPCSMEHHILHHMHKEEMESLKKRYHQNSLLHRLYSLLWLPKTQYKAILQRTGPGAWTRVLYAYLRQHGRGPEVARGGHSVGSVRILPIEAFGSRQPHSGAPQMGNTTGVLAVHKFAGSWKGAFYRRLSFWNCGGFDGS